MPATTHNLLRVTRLADALIEELPLEYKVRMNALFSSVPGYPGVVARQFAVTKKEEITEHEDFIPVLIFLSKETVQYHVGETDTMDCTEVEPTCHIDIASKRIKSNLS